MSQAEVSVLFEQGAIATRVGELGREITAAFAPRSVTVVAMMKGCIVFAADLIRALDLDLTCHFLRSSLLREQGMGAERTDIVYATDIPYDRSATTMAPFTMCPACRREYEDVGDRRFHAQPNACPVCGPRLTLHASDGVRIHADDVIAAAAQALRRRRASVVTAPHCARFANHPDELSWRGRIQDASGNTLIAT